MLALLLGVPATSFAQACPANQFAVCLGDSCICIPQLKGDTATLAADAMKALAEARAPALEAWITTSRNELYPAAAPIPADIRRSLRGYIADDIMDLARFRIADRNSETLNLGNMVIAYGDLVDGVTVQAITLVDVIVFNNETDAHNNPTLWAHELTHIKQFRDWGVGGFAKAYVSKPLDVEAEAYKVGSGYAAWKQDHAK